MTANAIDGLRSTSAGGTSLKIGEGQARDTTNTEWIVIPPGQERTVDITATGPGGLDTGAPQARKRYAVWVVSSGGTVAGLLSLSYVAPTVPPGATFRRVGSTYTNDSARLVAFQQHGTHNDRSVVFQSDPQALEVLTDATAAEFTFFSLAGPYPTTAHCAELYVVPSAGGRTELRSGTVVTRVETPTTLGYTAPSGTTKGEFRTPAGSTSIQVLGFDETV